MATVDATRRFLERAVDRGLLHPSNVRTLGLRSGLSCSALGFGAYRVGGSKHEGQHQASIRAAFRCGINLIDTSSHYSAASKGPQNASDVLGGGHGDSERLIGKVLAEAIEQGDITREEVVVCTKAGHVARGAARPNSAVSIGPQGGGDDWHSIDPDFLEAEVTASCDRLGTNPDFVLLHNPEYFLASQLVQRASIANAWDEMYEQLTAAFSMLEKLCDKGVIVAGYGVSANFLSCSFSVTGRPNVYEALALDRVVEAAARTAGGEEKHRLKIVQMPLNIAEGGAVLGRGEVVLEAKEGDCSLATKFGLGVITNRPLHAIPVPGISSGDWGRQGTSHIQLREKKPMGTVDALVQRVAVEASGLESIPFQQMALRLASSSPNVSSTLCGMRSERYVEDAHQVLKESPLSPEQVSHTLLTGRNVFREIGGDTRRFW